MSYKNAIKIKKEQVAKYKKKIKELDDKERIAQYKKAMAVRVNEIKALEKAEKVEKSSKEGA